MRVLLSPEHGKKEANCCPRVLTRTLVILIGFGPLDPFPLTTCNRLFSTNANQREGLERKESHTASKARMMHFPEVVSSFRRT